MITKAEPPVQREFAKRIHSEGAFCDADPTLKHELVSRLLEASVEKLALPLSPATTSYHQPADIKPDPVIEIAKEYFQTCLELQCEASAQSVLAKVADTSTLNRVNAQRRAKTLMLPFAFWVGEYLAAHPVPVALNVSVLEKAAIQAIVNAMAAKPQDISRADIANILHTFTLPGGPELFAAM